MKSTVPSLTEFFQEGFLFCVPVPGNAKSYFALSMDNAIYMMLGDLGFELDQYMTEVTYRFRCLNLATGQVEVGEMSFLCALPQTLWMAYGIEKVDDDK